MSQIREILFPSGKFSTFEISLVFCGIYFRKTLNASC